MSLFLSYSVDDNLDPEGWVINFHTRLVRRLKVIGGEELPLFLDRYDLDGNLLKESLEKHLNETKILLALVSPSYLRKDWCKTERSLFLKSLKKQVTDPEERIFIAIKMVDKGYKDISKEFIKTLPKELRRQRYFKFFELDSNNNPAELEFDHAKFKEALNDLARKLIDFINNVDGEPKTDNKKYIYVAESTREIGKNRQQIIREIESHGYGVYPTEQLPESSEEIIDKIKFYLSRATLSVNILGGNYGFIVPGTNKSLPQIQYELARSMGVPTIFWMDRTIKLKDETQISFIKSVNSELTDPSDFLIGSIEDFIIELSDKLNEFVK